MKSLKQFKICNHIKQNYIVYFFEILCYVGKSIFGNE